jgi:hypothetical protein
MNGQSTMQKGIAPASSFVGAAGAIPFAFGRSDAKQKLYDLEYLFVGQ